MKPKVYLAGKITNNWWRNEILEPNWSYTYPQTRTPGIDTFNNNNEYHNMEYDAGDFIVTGPHSIGCDHRCFHSIENGAIHAAGGNEFEPDYVISKEDIYKACRWQIQKSDIVFAYIDNKDAYGTLYELGIASAKHTNIYIVYKTKELADLHWFISQGANQTYVLEGSNKSLYDIFREIINKHNRR